MSPFSKIYDDFLEYDPINLEHTAAHCLERNGILKGKTRDEVVTMLLEKVRKEMNKFDKNSSEFLGQLHTAYNSFYIMDRHDWATTYNGELQLPPGHFVVNFFVRLGREPIKKTT
jgi:hypothetical protein